MQDEIKRLQNELICANSKIKGCDRDCLHCNRRFEDIEIIRAYEAAIEALEKQIPKKILYTFTNANSEKRIYGCPNCEHWLPYKGRKYCEYCGQALDWSEVE